MKDGEDLRRQQTRVTIREFAFTVDEPEAIGGRNEAPTPMEYLAGAADVQPYFHAYRLQVLVGTPETDPAVLRDFAAAVEHSCPAVNLLRDAHAGLTVAWSFAGLTVAHDAEAACNRALGYPVRNEPVDAPVPALTLEDADPASLPDGGARLGAPVTGRPGAEGVA